jgi:hypothetical protein
MVLRSMARRNSTPHPQDTVLQGEMIPSRSVRFEMNENERTNHWYWKVPLINFVIECKTQSLRRSACSRVYQKARKPPCRYHLVDQGKAF